MAQLVVRNLQDDVKARLQLRARRHGRSTEEEVREILRDGLTKRRITRQQFEDQAGLIAGTTDYSGFGRVPLVIEAVFEDIAVKQAA